VEGGPVPSHALLFYATTRFESECVGGGIAVSGWFVLMLSLAKVLFTLPLGDRRFRREKARARLHMQGKFKLLHVILSSHARLRDYLYFTGII